MKSITELPSHQRPREKLCDQGAQALSDVDLLAAVLGSGNRRVNVRMLARNVLAAIDNDGMLPSLERLMKVEGVGIATAAQLVAAGEFFRRRIRPEGVALTAPADVLPLISHLADRNREHFISVSINGAQEVIAVRTISIGLVDKTPVHPREVFAEALQDRASGIIVAHNHPSGVLIPSEADRTTTQVLVAAGDLLGVPVLDHIIFYRNNYYSFLEHELLREEKREVT